MRSRFARIPLQCMHLLRKEFGLLRSRFARIPLPAAIGSVVLVVLFVASFATLSWTLGARSSGAEPRYAEHRLDAALLAPGWAGGRFQASDSEAAHDGGLLGTDRFGRSLLVRSLLGGAVSIGIGLAAAVISVTIGVLVGALAGWKGGRVDAFLMRCVDVLYGLPYILLVVLLAVAGDALIQRWEFASGSEFEDPHRAVLQVGILLVAISGVSWLTMARVIRGQVLSLKGQPFIEAARATGVPVGRIFVRHLLPNLTGPILVYATLTVPQAVLQESFLSFLGIGVRPPLPSWGNMVAEGLGQLNPVHARWWLLAVPCVLLGFTLLSLNFVGEGLREAFDPRGRRH